MDRGVWRAAGHGTRLSIHTTYSQTQNKLMLVRVEELVEETVRDFGVDMYTLQHLNSIINKALL